MKALRLALMGLATTLLAGCDGAPAGVQPIAGFELQSYLGTWYEVARLDHPFERGLERITANYELRDDGGIRVTNRGYDLAKGEWREAVGKAYFVGAPDVGQLKVSFFGPFYGGYNIVALDKRDYRWVMICGPSTSYLWILSREPQLAPQVLDSLVGQARSLGFDTDQLIFVRH
jgi:apolipoprotein D and lipocalin family protein